MCRPHASTHTRLVTRAQRPTIERVVSTDEELLSAWRGGDPVRYVDLPPDMAASLRAAALEAAPPVTGSVEGARIDVLGGRTNSAT